MSRPAPRRPSRTTTPKPRKIAGRAGSPAEIPDTGTPDADDSAAVVPPSPRKPSGSSAPPSQPPKRPVARGSGPDDAGGGDDKPPSPALASGAVTRMLLVLVGVLVVLLVLQGLWFFLHDRENDDRAEAGSSAEPEAPDDDEYVPITATSDRPVAMETVEWQGGVEAAAAAAEAMFTRNFETYDEGVDQAAAMMTEQFAEQYRKTTDDIRQESINKKVQVEVRVIAQSVVRTNEAELEALVFLNQFTVRGEGDKARTTYTPYRALLKMVHTDKGWLVDDLDTK